MEEVLALGVCSLFPHLIVPAPNRPNQEDSGRKLGQYHLNGGTSWTRLARN